ncbi:M48 family metalloprotease [Modestobacter sp. I12A-02628]|uniref:M56 family metallopeptidase n=1 Tax=Goekera deserti TaxID=2497753 RepID=A0A7K3WKK3_9ACTN|nr:M56 family metallopeptidase [Goekera deserti]MPQ96693.1 M48 family metalloprotease [Goekera deserti]NDI46993.1 M48 family metalloprotease [Goekera deserti]NEL56230.1 M56 family metallopeptidase [Goekera deserti]
MLPASALVLAVLAALLAWPVPAALARSSWPRRDPLVALLCWQAIGLAGGLSIIGALLVHGLAPWGTSLPAAVWAFWTGAPAGEAVRGDHWIAMTLAGVLFLELTGVLLLSLVHTARTRTRHRQLLELIVQPGAGLPGCAASERGAPEARLLEHPAPVAFCIPGARPLLVLSSGMVAELDDAQLGAVVAHEQAHLDERHHLLLLPFVAWRAALPVLPAADRAHDAVRDLVEMRADDVALRSVPGPCPRRVLAAAIVAAAGGASGHGLVPGGALAVTGGVVSARVARLLEPPPPLGATGRATALACAVALLLLPALLLLVPAL